MSVLGLLVKYNEAPSVPECNKFIERLVKIINNYKNAAVSVGFIYNFELHEIQGKYYFLICSDCFVTDDGDDDIEALEAIRIGNIINAEYTRDVFYYIIRDTSYKKGWSSDINTLRYFKEYLNLEDYFKNPIKVFHI